MENNYENKQTNEYSNTYLITKTELNIFEYIVTICDVLLFSSALNCLFQMLSYMKTFDIIQFIISLSLGILVYYFGIGNNKSPIINVRILVALCSVLVWALTIPVLYNIV